MSASKRRKNSLRHPHWDYRNRAFYFVTILTYQRLCFFDDANLKARIEEIFLTIPKWDSCSHVKIDEWVVMPNHIHAIFFLDLDPNELELLEHKNTPKSLGTVVGTFKRVSTRLLRPMMGEDFYRLWHRGYHDRIVRNERELNAIRQYIQQNPAKWEEDKNNLDSLLTRMTPHQ